MRVNVEGSVRVDLLGGTIDLVPINQILRDTVTLNIATSLKAKVEIEEVDFDGIIIESKDYNSTTKFNSSDFTIENFDGEHFGALSFVCQILAHFKLTKNAKVTLESGSPPGAGLGGSSSMGVTLYKALAKYLDQDFDRLKAINVVQNIESKILNMGPCGYQDYYPALFGGVLALVPTNSRVRVEQLYSEELKEFLENRITLIYSGALRFSAINNWEVYKDFFDKRNGVREGLTEIAKLSREAYQAILDNRFEELLELITREGQVRESLFEGIVTPEIRDFFNQLKSKSLADGMKMCGAGGGGCFIIVHKANLHDKIKEEAVNASMKVLDFKLTNVI
ncbi:GHMP kinase [Bacteriovorax sp. Seq25_V]|uniref:GHMP family kinase ATP-binding protein n=1 Tax=Bacteriovorax sp. Seq25_V TaxID=1201288 RepID=UPI00038A13A4|nr:GHMP kinase [Bacteriovorax sp. Seq25_V]EQC47617.1 GHMP kinase C-terminal domain protein [Bacteriovorax sp. Seq25_V]